MKYILILSLLFGTVQGQVYNTPDKIFPGKIRFAKLDTVVHERIYQTYHTSLDTIPEKITPHESDSLDQIGRTSFLKNIRNVVPVFIVFVDTAATITEVLGMRCFEAQKRMLVPDSSKPYFSCYVIGCKEDHRPKKWDWVADYYFHSTEYPVRLFNTSIILYKRYL